MVERTNPRLSAPAGTEEQTASPVAASIGEHVFRFMGEAAFEQGYITREGLERVCDALYGRAQ